MKGFPGVNIDAALLEIPGGVLLELLDYRLPDRVPHVDDTRHPGNVHLCLRTDDAEATWARALACGARSVSPNGPVELDGGPNKGAKAAYLRDPDGVSLELFQLPPRLRQRRYERLSAAGLQELMDEAPVAYAPIGTLEYHGPHLPFGVDGVTAHELALRAAQTSGGVVLPSTYLATGCLDLPGTLTFSAELVERWARETIAQLHGRGFRAVVLLSGHGPLDLLHLLKRVCREEMEAREGLSAYALHWLELNAARLEGPEDGEPTLVDHAAAVETSWMLALRPEDVRTDRLPDDPAARPLGVYGPNPRFTADGGRGATQLAAAAELLSERVTAMLDGRPVDQEADLGAFVEHGWPEPLRLAGRAGSAGQAALLVTNPGRASRYVSECGAWWSAAPRCRGPRSRCATRAPASAASRWRPASCGPRPASTSAASRRRRWSSASTSIRAPRACGSSWSWAASRCASWRRT